MQRRRLQPSEATTAEPRRAKGFAIQQARHLKLFAECRSGSDSVLQQTCHRAVTVGHHLVCTRHSRSGVRPEDGIRTDEQARTLRRSPRNAFPAQHCERRQFSMSEVHPRANRPKSGPTRDTPAARTYPGGPPTTTKSGTWPGIVHGLLSPWTLPLERDSDRDCCLIHVTDVSLLYFLFIQVGND